MMFLLLTLLAPLAKGFLNTGKSEVYGLTSEFPTESPTVAIPTYRIFTSNRLYRWSGVSNARHILVSMPSMSTYEDCVEECESRGSACWGIQMVGLQEVLFSNPRLIEGQSVCKYIITREPSNRDRTYFSYELTGAYVFRKETQVWNEVSELCTGLTYTDLYGYYLEDCRAACALDVQCEVYQWIFTAPQDSFDCYIGKDSFDCSTSYELDGIEVIESYRKQETTTKEATTKKATTTVVPICTDCSCSGWDGSNYSNCWEVTHPHVKPCNGYCVKCEADGETPMPGLHTHHAAECAVYEQRAITIPAYQLWANRRYSMGAVGRDGFLVEMPYTSTYSDCVKECESRGTGCWGFQMGGQGVCQFILTREPSSEEELKYGSDLSSASILRKLTQLWDQESERCMGLTFDPDAFTVEQCQSACALDGQCEVYQWYWNTLEGGHGHGECFKGKDIYDCSATHELEGFEVVEGYRKQVSGERRVLASLDINAPASPAESIRRSIRRNL